MLLTVEQFGRAADIGPLLAAKWHAPVMAAAAAYAIDTKERITSFIPQTGHESGGFVYVKELWGPTDAQRRYEGRADLGNTQAGDGFKYRGRGLIQITGRTNYSDVAAALKIDALAHPELLELPEHAAMSAAWFWSTRGLNELADAGDFRRITRRINGGLNGYDDRARRWEVAKRALGIA